jgi:DNA-binding CsgD family transcriptional regulator/tetratricopeptide (TPR) repeat protein
MNSRIGLHGRDEELRWLNAVLGTAQRGAGALVAIEGAPGTGKSRLVQEACERARGRGALVLGTRALDCDPDVLGRLLAAAERAGATAERLDRAVAALAAERPVVVAVDDVERSDVASLRALAALTVQLDDLGGVAVVLARRHDGVGCATADAMFGDPGAIRMRLGALDEHAVAALLANVLGRDPSPSLVADVVELTRGNAFLVTELALAVRERGSLDDLALSSVARWVHARVPNAGELLDALAVDPALTDGDCAALVAAGVLASADPPRFAQPLLRTAILGALDPRERSRLHAAAARVVADPAEHLLATAPAGDEWTARRLRDAAHACGGAQAAAYLRRALAEGVMERELSTQLGELLLSLGDAEAQAHLERALALGGDPRTGLALVRLHIARGDDEAAARAGETALRDAEGDVRARLEDELAHAGDIGRIEDDGSLVGCRGIAALAAEGRLEEALALYDFALGRAEARGTTFTTAAVRAGRAPVRLRLGDVPGAIDDARAALAAPLFGGCGPVCGPAVQALAEALIEVGDLEGALALASHPAATPGARARVYLAHDRHAAALQETDGTGLLAARAHLGLGDARRSHELAAAEPRSAESLRVLALTSSNGLALCREAVELLAGSPALLDRAHALVDLGCALRRRGRKREARDVLRDGMDVAHRCGATRLVARARDELVAAGGRPRRAAHHGVDGLTRTERRVAELAAAGLSNREIGGELFVTINTVCAHLASVYRKLDISSRAQLPVLLATTTRSAS